MLKELTKPVIFAHRGSSAHAPENTLAAFRLAIEHGADAIELDAKLSADDEVVVIHDATVDRTTNRNGPVRSFTAEEFGKMDAGSFFSDAYRGEPVPMLEQVFAEVGKKIFINVELTNYASPQDALPEKVAKLVKAQHLEEWVMFSSFYPFNLARIKKLLPDCPVAILALEGSKGWLTRSFAGRYYAPEILHPNLADTTKGLIEREHKRRRRVHTWTVNDPADLKRLFEWGIDGVFTDDPILARRIREQG